MESGGSHICSKSAPNKVEVLNSFLFGVSPCGMLHYWLSFNLDFCVMLSTFSESQGW